MTPPGNVQPALPEVLSTQYDATVDPATPTGTLGLACVAALPGSTDDANVEIAPAPVYATSTSEVLLVALTGTVTVDPPVAPSAVRVRRNDETSGAPSAAWPRSVHPAGAVIVPLRLIVTNSTS